MEYTAETQETLCPAREGKEPARGSCLPCPQPLSRAAQVRAENTASPGKGDRSHVSSRKGKSQRLAIRDALWRQSILPPGMPLKRLIYEADAPRRRRAASLPQPAFTFKVADL